MQGLEITDEHVARQVAAFIGDNSTNQIYFRMNSSRKYTLLNINCEMTKVVRETTCRALLIDINPRTIFISQMNFHGNENDDV